MMKIFAVTLLLTFAPIAYAQNERADAAFCKYANEQGMATRDQLRTPSLTVGPTQPSTGTPPQLVVGLTTSLADYKKSVLTMKLARKTCELYQTTTEAQMHIAFALPQIEKDVLGNRLRLIDGTSAKLDDLIAENMKRVTSQNLTVPSVYPLQSAQVRLDEIRLATLTIASPYVPTLSNVPLKVLVASKLQSEDESIKALTKLTQQNTWDVQLGGGIRRRLPSTQVDVFHSSWGAYGFFNLTYNLGRKAVSNHLDNSVSAYNEWKQTQFDDVATQATVLEKQIEDTIKIQAGQLSTMETHGKEIDQSLKALEGVDTNTAIGFRNTLLADQLMLQIDVRDIQYRIARLEQYLTENFYVPKTAQ
jgi:hypothetical protein